MYKCENCGGDLIFDPKSQQMKCKSCNTLFPIDINRDKDIEVEEDGSMSADVFVCPNCGGQLIGATESIVDFCPYCGTQVQTKTEKIMKKMPEAIVPFSITKDQCKDIYKKNVKKYFFAPSEMKSEKFINRVQGVYVPYWSYFTDVNGQIWTECVDSRRSGDYIYKSYYDYHMDVQGQAIVSYDAEKDLDDNLSAGAGGFRDDSIKKFTPQYLSGYYADLPNVPSSDYLREAENKVKKATVDKANAGTGMPVSRTSDNGLNVKTTPRRSAMPLYFLTWRGNGTVAYSLVNGQSGQLSAQLPIDFKKYFITSLIAAIPLFLIFFFANMTIMPETLAVFSGLILSLSMMASIIAGHGALKKEKFVFDVRNNSEGLLDSATVSGIKSRAKTKALSWVITFVVILMVLFHFSLHIIRAVVLILGIIMFIVSLVISAKARALGEAYPKGWFSSIAKGMTLSGFPSLIGIILSDALTFIDLTHDEIYYGIAVYSMLISILIYVSVIKEYNYSVTRPVKYFEGRKGLSDHV